MIAGRAAQRVAPARREHEPREAHELRVELLVEHAGGPARRLDGLQRSRDVRAVRVVLRVGDLAAGRDQHDHRDADRERGEDRRRRRPAQAGDAAADRERDQEPERRPAPDGEPDQLAEVVHERVARLGADLLDVERLALREVRHDAPVDGLQVDPEADRRADRLEARAPVHERHVDVERAAVAGGDRHADLADGEHAVLVVADERQVGAARRGEHDEGQRERAPRGRQDRDFQSRRAQSGGRVLRCAIAIAPTQRRTHRLLSHNSIGLRRLSPSCWYRRSPSSVAWSVIVVRPWLVASASALRMTWVARPCRLACGTVATNEMPQSSPWCSASATAAGAPLRSAR